VARKTRLVRPVIVVAIIRLAGLAFRARLAHRPGRSGDEPASPPAQRIGKKAGGARAWCGVSDRPTWKDDHMALYEHVFLARQDLAQAQVDTLAETATRIIEDNGGKIVKNEGWGLRGLAYRIAKNRKAHYVMLEIDAPSAAIVEMERQIAINEDVIRYMTVRVETHEEGPSAMMRRNERDRGDRGGRGDRGDRGGDRGDRGPRREREDRPRDDRDAA
jgi:small subunit ribosomal protein S6